MICHASFNSPIGFLTVFEDGGVIVAVESGRAPDASASSALLRAVGAALDRYFDALPEPFDFPLLPAPTPFQQRVRAAMRAIPFGRTRTYADLARELGSAPRAIGTACARNPLPILVPCHRVIGSDGGLHGFSFPGGVDTKRDLLRLEGHPFQSLFPEEK